MRYRNALKMIDWLERAFGFERRAVHMSGEITAPTYAMSTLKPAAA
jgi:uncharacterized glyoxalase superfamily protein PhnB